MSADTISVIFNFSFLCFKVKFIISFKLLSLYANLFMLSIRLNFSTYEELVKKNRINITMATISDKFSALGTAIINLVGTRANTDLSNLTQTGENKISSLAGVPQSSLGCVCLSLAPTNSAYSTGSTTSDFTVTCASASGLSPSGKNASTGVCTNTKIDLTSISSKPTYPATVTSTSPVKLTMFINSSKAIVAKRYIASYTTPQFPSSELMWYDLDANKLKTYSGSAWSEYAGFAIGELVLTGTNISNVKFYKSLQLADTPTVTSSMLNSNVPVGTVISYMGSTVPDGYLLMDGRTLSRSTYANLFAVIGTTQGAGDGSTTFGIADMTDGRYLMGSTVAGSSQTEIPWSQPVATSYSTSITGGDMLIEVGTTYDSVNYSGWKAFDSSTSSAWAGGGATNWCRLSLPYSIKISKVRFHNLNTAGGGNTKTIKLYSGKNTSSGTLLGTVVNSNAVSPYYCDINIDANDRVWSSQYYIYFPDCYASYTPYIRDIEITATVMDGVSNPFDVAWIADNRQYYCIKY